MNYFEKASDICPQGQDRTGQDRTGQDRVEWSGVEWSGVEWSGVEWSGFTFLKDLTGHLVDVTMLVANDLVREYITRSTRTLYGVWLDKHVSIRDAQKTRWPARTWHEEIKLMVDAARQERQRVHAAHETPPPACGGLHAYSFL